MIGLLQRVSQSSVTVNERIVGKIDRGLMVLVGVEKTDSEDTASRLLDKLLAYRVFPDEAGRMNLSLSQIEGGLLLVPQFTLAADTQKGLRPSFAAAAPPEQAEALFSYLVDQARQRHRDVACGEFAADMQVALINDGPVTFELRSQ